MTRTGAIAPGDARTPPRAGAATGPKHRAAAPRPAGMLRANALIAVSSGMVGVTSYACALLMARLLPVAAYSDFSAGQTLLTTVGVTASAMIPMPLARTVRSHPRGSRQRRAGMAFAVLVSLLVGLAAGAVLTAVALLFSGPGIALVIGLCGLGLFAIMPVWGWLQGEGRFIWYTLLSLAEVFLRLTISLIAARSRWGAAGVLAGYLAGICVVMGTGAVLLRRDLSWRPRVLGDRKRWLETGGVALVQLAVSALVSADVMLVAIMAGQTRGGAGYQAVATLAKGPVYVAAGTALVSFPALCSARPGRSGETVRSTLSSFAWLAVPTAAVLATVPAALAVRVLPARYATSLSLLPWLATAGLGLGIVSVLAVILLAVGTYRQSLSAVAGSAVFVLGGIAAGWSADSTRGLAAGAAAGALAAAAMAAAITFPYLPPGLSGPAVRTFVRGAVATGILLLSRPVPWLWLLAVIALIGIVFRGQGRERPGAGRAAPATGPLRITHLGFEDPAMPGAGGGSLRTHEIGRRLATRGHQLTVLVSRFPGCADRVQDGVRYVHVGFLGGRTRLGRLIGYAVLLPVMVRRYPADLVVEEFFAPISTMAAPIWSGRPTIGIVQWLNARDKARQYRVPVHFVERFGVRRYRHLVAVSAGTGRKLSALNPHAHISIVGNGVDPAAFTVSEVRGPDVVFVGRLEIAQKGLDLLLQAWASIAPQVTGQLVLAGIGPDEAQLRRMADRLGIGEQVRFAGWVSGTAKYRLMAGARLVVVPSRFETFGIVAVEALAAGTPVLAFDITCLREVIPSGSGRLAIPFDVVQYAKFIIDMYYDDSWQHRASTQGREFAARYDWGALALRQEEIYRGVVTGKAQAADGTPAASAAGQVRAQLQDLGQERSQGKRPSRITVVGNAGNSNTGDEALLAVALARLDLGSEATVISRDPDQVTAIHGVPAVPMTLRGGLTALLRCDGLVVVGGGMFGPGLPPLVRLLPAVATWARRTGRGVAYLGIGVYPGVPRGTLRRLRQAAERSEITVRDLASAETLGARRPVRCVGDLAWHLQPASSGAARRMLAGAGVPEERPLLLVSAKAAPASEQTEWVIDSLAEAVRQWTSRGGAVAAIALSDHTDFGRDPAMTDLAMAGIVGERARAVIPVVGPNLDPALAKAVVGQADAVVGYRFHALVFALSAGIPCLGIPGEPKTEALMTEHDVPAYAGTEALESWLDTIWGQGAGRNSSPMIARR